MIGEGDLCSIRNNTGEVVRSLLGDGDSVTFVRGEDDCSVVGAPDALLPAAACCAWVVSGLGTEGARRDSL
jgi:hypothetical protein